ncbi:hypothetical protein M5W83_16390 [Paenibacillus thiaminolyticus]|uniref:Uncharacterized protein n=1 Tax=Paenibacillus thiaminolyticus TaxID=49283 RepID=A0ABT4FX37_PANTH|nr:hypothetical protein [Paenibacillus thiaminolyticus]MCY9536010.1 hypothetical protein [Paenibacillus thiaminolyticus]MCY9602329.1 hypothetical protein [Paenibacillus thiaminolyticus]MCY9608724.1 hypothetical protein [Paenibacillus thiaminolyticus]MCY9613471.1 hypothetical protein [Paenibacillus thiaminolyticus]MCY9620289.1 hypothetical protein [Paenibacillus thiaminolyticus]
MQVNVSRGRHAKKERIISLQEMMQLDSSIAELADLPLGWAAWRNSAADEWHRQKK